jgi:prepilin-type N-terminal cleavage/methylation domain-containing protein
MKTTLRNRIQRTRSPRSNESGFTLIELVITVAVIAILSVIGVPTYLDQLERARVSTRNSSAVSAAKACLVARINNNTAAFTMPAGATGTCTQTGVNTITSDVEGPGTQAVVTIAAPGDLALTTPATGS